MCSGEALRAVLRLSVPLTFRAIYFSPGPQDCRIPAAAGMNTTLHGFAGLKMMKCVRFLKSLDMGVSAKVFHSQTPPDVLSYLRDLQIFLLLT